jgi:hypothetical protein
MKKKIFLFGLLGLGLAAAGVVVSVVWFFVSFYMSMERGEEHRRQVDAEQRSGKWDFGDQPALFAVVDAIVKNDQDAIRAAAKALPNLQTPGRDGTTLLYFAVTQSWQRPESVEAVKTLLSLGADPNYTNGQRNSFALANAVHGSALLLRYMLEAGGDPNARNEFSEPMILMNWYLGYYKNDARARLDLLLDHGADINATMPERESEFDGYTLLLYRTEMGPRYSEYGEAYADALYLLERGADPNRAAADGMTFPKMLMKHRQQFRAVKRTPPEFEALWEWAQTHGILHWPE